VPIKTIILVEDHPIFRKGLASLINSNTMLKVIGEAQNSSEAVLLLEKVKPVMAIIDLKLGDEDGLELIKLLRSIRHDLYIIVLSMNDERYYAERALKAGAQGYVMKEEAGSQVINAINTVMSGQVWLSTSEKERLRDYMNTGDSLKNGENWLASIQKLSDRQLQIFSLLGRGLGSMEIAQKLNISTKTVDAHKEHIKLKMHCESSKELRQWAIEWGSQ